MQKIVVIHQIGQQLRPTKNYFQNYNVLNTSSWPSSSTGRTTTLIFRACFWSRHASTSSSYTTSFHCISDSMVYFPRTPVSVLSSVTCIFLTWNLSKYGICSCAIYNDGVPYFWMIWNRYLHSIDLPLSLYRRKGERDRVLLNLRCTGSLEPLLKIKYKENCAKNGISWQSKAQPKIFELIWVDLSFNSIIWFEGDNSLTC